MGVYINENGDEQSEPNSWWMAPSGQLHPTGSNHEAWIMNEGSQHGFESEDDAKKAGWHRVAVWNGEVFSDNPYHHLTKKQANNLLDIAIQGRHHTVNHYGPNNKVRTVWSKESTKLSRKPKRYARFTLGQSRPFKVPSGEPAVEHDYHDETGKKVGVVRVVPRNDGRMLHVHWVGPVERQGLPNEVGIEAMRSIKEQLAGVYPKAEFLSGNRISGFRTNSNDQKVVVPLRKLSRKLPRRFAKVDGDVVAHNLVHGFPIEHALRHLANDPANPGDIRDLAYVALTGRNKLTGEVKQEGHPEALWALYDALQEHDHPAKDWYHWMNAADKLQHDQHTYTALLEEAERMRKDHGRSHTARRDWAYRPEGQAVRIGQEFGEDNKDAFDVKMSRQQALGRIHARVKQLAGSHLDEKAINESIMRHVVRANHVWRREHGVDTSNDVRRATQAFEEVKDRPGHNLHHKAARYDRKVKPKKYMFIDKTYVKGKSHEGWHVSWLSPGGKFFPVPAHSSHAEQSRAMGFEGPDALFQNGWHRVIVQGRDVYVYNPHMTLNHKQKGELTDAAMTEGMTAVNHDNGKTTRVIWDKQDRFQRRYALAVRGDFIDALRKIQSSNHKSLRQVAEQVSRKVGLGMVKVLPGLHDTSRGSVPGIVQAIYGHATPEQVHQVASWIGLTGNLPGMAVFHARPEGADLLHKFRQQGSGIELRDKLDRAGIRDRVIAIPSGNPTQVGYDVLVPDKGGRMAPMIQDYAKRQGVPLQTSRGYFKTVGSQNQAQARDKYRTQVSKTEGGS